jgi:putative sterol carrier protein
MANLQTIFDSMSERFQADKAGDLDMTIQFDLSGDGGGQWYANIEDGAMSVNKGSAEAPSATLKMDADDFAKMSNGDLNPMMAFMSGKIKVDGDLNSVMKFQTLVGL